MRLWHQLLIPYLDRQHLLGQHRECCALRGNGWRKKHATVDYVFKYSKIPLICYHRLVIEEMENRGYHVNEDWKSPAYNGKIAGWDYREFIKNQDIIRRFLYDHIPHHMAFREHNHDYLIQCITLLKERNAPMDFDSIEKNLLKGDNHV